MVLVALLWGMAFPAQRAVAESAGVFVFNGARYLLGALALLLFTRGRLGVPPGQRRLLLLTGLVMFAASGLQQAGMLFTSSANAGFITSLYVILVPLILYLFFRIPTGRVALAAAGVAVLGAMLLSGGGQNLSLNPRSLLGDFLELLGAGLWALHLILVGKAVQKVDVLAFSFWQSLVAAAAHLVFGAALEGEKFAALGAAWWAVGYVGIFSVAVAYTLQAYAQRHAPPADAAIILSLEAVFAALGGYFFLQESLLAVQILGCALIFAAVLLAQLPRRERQISR